MADGQNMHQFLNGIPGIGNLGNLANINGAVPQQNMRGSRAAGQGQH